MGNLVPGINKGRASRREGGFISPKPRRVQQIDGLVTFAVMPTVRVDAFRQQDCRFGRFFVSPPRRRRSMEK